MKCFYYKMMNKRTGKVIFSNFNWAEKFADIKQREESSVVKCEEISRDEFKELRRKGV